MRLIARFNTKGYWKSYTIDSRISNIIDFLVFVKDIVREYFIIRKTGLNIEKLTVEKQ